MTELIMVNRGNPGAFWTECSPTDEEVQQNTNASGDYESASDSVFFQCEPNEFDGDTRAVLRDKKTGAIIHYDYGTGKCYSQRGEELPEEYTEAAHVAGIPAGDASSEESLKLLISQVEPLIGSPENVTLVTPKNDDDEQ